jgi:hypothetical protein
MKLSLVKASSSVYLLNCAQMKLIKDRYRTLLGQVMTGALVLTQATAGLALDGSTDHGSQLEAPAKSSESTSDSFLSQVSVMQVEGWQGDPAISSSEGPAPSTDAWVMSQGSRGPLLREYGCISALQRVFHRGQRQVDIAVFSFPSSDFTYGAYSTMRQGATTVVVRGAGSSEDEDSITFWKDRYLVILSMNPGDDESKDLLRQLADTLSGVINGGTDSPAILKMLPRIERVKGSERLFVGPFSFRKVVSLPNSAALELNACRKGICADYQIQVPSPERLRLIIIDYGSPEKASSICKNYIAATGANRKSLSDGLGTVIKLDGSYLYCQANGSYLILTSGARKRGAAGFLARQIGN